MDLDRAHATVGVDASTSLRDAHGAYVLRAKMLHPDQYGSSEHLRHEAERAMSQLTEAWDVIQRAGENRHTPAAATAAAGWDPPADLRLPVQGECDFCGSRPAKLVSLRGVRAWSAQATPRGPAEEWLRPRELSRVFLVPEQWGGRMLEV